MRSKIYVVFLFMFAVSCKHKHEAVQDVQNIQVVESTEEIKLQLQDLSKIVILTTNDENGLNLTQEENTLIGAGAAVGAVSFMTLLAVIATRGKGGGASARNVDPDPAKGGSPSFSPSPALRRASDASSSVTSIDPIRQSKDSVVQPQKSVAVAGENFLSAQGFAQIGSTIYWSKSATKNGKSGCEIAWIESESLQSKYIPVEYTSVKEMKSLQQLGLPKPPDKDLLINATQWSGWNPKDIRFLKQGEQRNFEFQGNVYRVENINGNDFLIQNITSNGALADLPHDLRGFVEARITDPKAQDILSDDLVEKLGLKGGERYIYQKSGTFYTVEVAARRGHIKGLNVNHVDALPPNISPDLPALFREAYIRDTDQRVLHDRLRVYLETLQDSYPSIPKDLWKANYSIGIEKRKDGIMYAYVIVNKKTRDLPQEWENKQYPISFKEVRFYDPTTQQVLVYLDPIQNP